MSSFLEKNETQISFGAEGSSPSPAWELYGHRAANTDHKAHS